MSVKLRDRLMSKTTSITTPLLLTAVALLFFVGVVEGALDPRYGEHRPVFVDVELLSLESIDGVSQTFTADFFLSICYQDALVTVPTDETETLPSSATYDHIGLEFVNSQSVTEQYNYVYATDNKPSAFAEFGASVPDITGMPWVRTEARYQGVFKVELSLHDFPFDRQRITLELESNNHDIDHAEFVVNTQTDMLDRAAAMVEWDMLQSSVEVTSSYYHIKNETFSRADFHIDIRRKPDYYMDKIAAGVALLVCMSWFLFALPTADTNRQTTSATLFLAVVGYLFIVTSDVPKVPYTTRLGDFITLSIAEIFLQYFFACVFCAIERAAASAEANAEKKVAEAEKRAKRGLKALGGKAETVLESLPDSDGHVAGWWDKWAKLKVLLDFVVACLLILVYVIATPLLLRYTD